MNKFYSSSLKVSVLAFAGWMLSTQAFASVDVDGVFYDLNKAKKTAVVVANPDKYSDYVYIPNDITVDDVTYTVTSIADCAFLDCRELRSVDIAATELTTIGYSAFERCYNMYQVTLPEGLESIDYEAFKNCKSLQVLNFPSTMKMIGDRSLLGCTCMRLVIVPESVFYLGEEWLSDTPLRILNVEKKVPLSIKSPTFAGFDKENCVLCVREGSKEAYQTADVWKDFPNIREVDEVGVCGEDLVFTINPEKTMIVWGTGEMNFYGRYPSSLIDIAEHPYEKLIIEDGATSIGTGAFNEESLASVTIPNSVTAIGYKPFHASQWYKDQPDGVVYAGKVLYDLKGDIMNGADVVLEEGTLGIALSALQEHSIASLTIPSSLINIPILDQEIVSPNFYIMSTFGDVGSFIVDANNPIYDSRDNCNAIIETATNRMIVGGSQTTVPDGVTAIGCWVLGQLSTVTIPTSVTDIDPFAFASDSILTLSPIYGSSYETSSIIEAITMEGSTPPALNLLEPLKGRADLLLFDTIHFPGVDTENCILYVPLGSMSDYMNADGWKDFKNIVEYDPNQGPTAIETVRESSTAPRQIFDLQGRRMNDASGHSFIIENGKKRIQR